MSRRLSAVEARERQASIAALHHQGLSAWAIRRKGWSGYTVSKALCGLPAAVCGCGRPVSHAGLCAVRRGAGTVTTTA